MNLKTTLLGFLFCVSASAQVAPALVADISDGNVYDGMSDMVLHNNMLYISNSDAGNIIRVSVSAPNAVPEVFIDNLSSPTGLAVVGNELFFLQAANALFAPNSGTLSKINLAVAAATPTQVVGSLRFPTELEISNTKAYIVESVLDASFDLDHTELALVNFSGTPTKTILYNNFYSLDDLELNGNDLYMVEWKESTDTTSILKLNVASGLPGTPSVFYTDTQGFYPYKLEISNNKLYFNVDDDENATIYSLNLALSNPTAVAAVTPFEFEGNGVYVGEIVVSGNMLYAFGVAEQINTVNYLIYGADITPLSVSDPVSAKFGVYPNPFTDTLTIEGLGSQTPYTIFDVTGKVVASDVTNMSQAINTTNLKAGVYLLSIDGQKAVKIVKK